MRCLLLSLTVTLACSPALACQDAPTPPPADEDPAAPAAGEPSSTDDPDVQAAAPRAPLVLQDDSLGSNQPPTAEEFFDGLVAPMALAPDMLLTPVMGALSNPEALIKAAAAMAEHPNDQKPPPMPSGHLAVLAHAPELLHLMADNPEWMDLMKQGMTFKRAEVMTAIQRVRRGALEVGNLKTDSVITVKDIDGRITIGLTDETVLRVPRYDGSLVYLTPLEEGPQLLAYGPALTFPGYRTAAAGLRSLDSITSMRTGALGGFGKGGGGAGGGGTHYPNVGARRSLMPGLLISRNHSRNRDDPARRLTSMMGWHAFY